MASSVLHLLLIQRYTLSLTRMDEWCKRRNFTPLFQRRTKSRADSKNPVVKHSEGRKEGRKQGRSPLSLWKFGGFLFLEWIEISIEFHSQHVHLVPLEAEWQHFQTTECDWERKSHSLPLGVLNLLHCQKSSNTHSPESQCNWPHRFREPHVLTHRGRA